MVSDLRKQKDARRKEKTREALLDASARVFASKGYHAALISDVVGEVGAGQGTFYRHFENKRQVMDELFDRFVESLLAEFTEIGQQPPTNVEEYRKASVDAYQRVIKVALENRELALMFLRQGPSIDEDFEGKLSDVFDRFAALAKFYLDLAIAGGFARPCNTELISQSIIGIGLRQAELLLTDRLGDLTTETLVNELVDFAFWGFGPGRKAWSDA